MLIVLILIPPLCVVVMAGLLLEVGLPYITLRRKALYGERLQKFNNKVERIGLITVGLVILSVLAEAFLVKYHGR